MELLQHELNLDSKSMVFLLEDLAKSYSLHVILDNFYSDVHSYCMNCG